MTRRRLGLIAGLIVLLVLAAVGGRSLMASRNAAAPATPSANPSANPGAGLTTSSAGAATSQPGAGTKAAGSAALELAADDLLTLAPRELSRGVAISGSLKAVNSAVLKAKVAGELLELLPREGDSVAAGQLLGRIDATDAELRLKQAEHNVEAAQAQVDLARRQLDNNRALVGQGYISTTALDNSVANDNGARANLQVAQSAVDIARKAVGDTRLIAPIAGQVAQRLAQPGERLPIDARVIEIVDLARIELEAALAPQDAGALRPGAAARLDVEGVTDPVAARIARINPSTQAGTRAVMVYLALQPTPAQARSLRSGLFARGTVELGRARLPALPLSAVHVDESKPYVLVFESGSLMRRTVVLGERGNAPGSADEWVEIRSGLSTGAQVLSGAVGTVPSGTPARLLTPAGAMPPAGSPALSPTAAR
jgi:RND family efflux transporter MFP subunit